MTKCPFCAKQSPPGRVTCWYCGKRLPSWEGADRREFVRIEANVVVRYEIIGATAADNRTVLAGNIGLGGILLVSEKPGPIGSNLRLSIKIPTSERPVELLGRVVRVEEITQDVFYDIGIIFTEVPPGNRASIEQFIEQRRRKGGTG